MESLPHHVLQRVLETLQGFVLRPGMCDCVKTGTFLVKIGESVTIGHSSGHSRALIDAIVLDESGSLTPRNFLGVPLLCSCPMDAMRKHVKIAIPVELLGLVNDVKGPHILLNAVVRDDILDVTGEGSALLPSRDSVADVPTAEVKVGEMFCGGFGGWAHAVRSLSTEDKMLVTRWGLDRDPICCATYLKSHQLHQVVNSRSGCASYLEPQEQHMMSPDLVFHASVEDYWWMSYAFRMEAQMITMSPPCPPWSTADLGGGLCKREGFTLLTAILLMTFLRPRIWGGENVASLRSHKHWPIIQAAIRWSGFEVVWSTCLDLQEQLPQHRDRLLIIAKNCRDEELDNHRIVSWPSTTKHSLQSYGVLLDLEGYWLEQSLLTRDELMQYLEPRHASAGNTGVAIKRARKDMVEFRLKTENDVVTCILTTYGKPHAVAEDARNRGGLYGSLILKGNTIRKLTVPELVILFGTVKPCWLPSSNDVATTLLGNAISIPHALITLINMVSFIRPLWFGDRIQATFASICREHLSKWNMTITADEDGFWFSQADQEAIHVADTQLMAIVKTLTVESPLQQYKLQVEEGVCIRRMLQTIMGASLPPRLDIEIASHKKVYIPLNEEAPMPDVDMKLASMQPSCLIPQENQIDFKDWPFVLVLAPSATVVFKREVCLCPPDIELRMQSCLDQEEEGQCLTLYGEPCNITQQCNNVLLFVPGSLKVYVQCPSSIRFQRCHEGFQLHTHADHVQDLRHYLFTAGLDLVIHALGWEMSMLCDRSFAPNDSGTVCIRLTRAAGRLALQPVHFENVMRTLIFIGQMQKVCVANHNVTRVSIKLWSTWVWTQWVPTNEKLCFITDAWRTAARFFGLEAEMRLIKGGKQLNPDCTIGDYWDGNEPGGVFRIHLILQLSGGGPPRKRPASDVRNASEGHDNGDDASSDGVARAITIEDDYGKPSPYSRVSESVEETVAVMLKRLIELKAEDVFLPIEIIENLTMVEEQNQLSMWGSIQQILRYMEFAQRSGLEQIMNELGWQNLVRFPEFRPGARVQMVVVPIPGMRCHPLTTTRGFIISALTYCRMPPSLSYHESLVRVQINLWGTIITDGYFKKDMLCGHFNRPWNEVTTFQDQPSEMRLIFRGKQMSAEYKLQDYLPEGVNVMKVHLVLQLRGGGPPLPGSSRDKPDAITRARNDVAKLLLEMGCDLQATSAAVQNLIKKSGLTAVNGAMRKKDPSSKLSAIMELAHSVDVKLPEINQAAMHRQNIVQRKMSQQSQAMSSISPSQCTLKSDHFTNQDGSPCTLLKTIASGSSGVVMADFATAAPWLENNQQLSADELAIFIFGGCPQTKDGCCKIVCVPAYNELNEPIVVSGCLHNVGAKPVKMATPHGADVVIPESCICAVTTYRDEVEDSTWAELIQHPIKQTMNILQDSGVVIQTMGTPWGKSWWGNKGKCTPEMATSLQVHMRIPKSKLKEVLRASGAQGLYVNPKNDKGVIDTSYAIVWSDQPIAQLRVTAATIQASLGLVRITRSQSKKTTRGVRVHADDFADTFSQMKPSEEVPTHIQVQHIAKLAPTPVGVSQDELRKWIAKVGLDARPIKPLSHRAWLLGFATKVDTTWYTWNSQVMMLTFLPPRDQEVVKPVVAGHVPIKEETSSSNKMMLQSDPWAPYLAKQAMASGNLTPAAPPAASGNNTGTRSTSGPVEERFKQQDAQIDNLKQAMSDLRSTVEQSAASQQEFRVQVQDKFQGLEKDVNSQLVKLGKSFESSLQSAMKQQDKQLSESFRELKLLFQNMPDPKKKARTQKPTKADANEDGKQDENMENETEDKEL
eukprot:Skav201140  [mRNA]  locus=scaffold4217:208928:214363:- [translate_table: standard]